MTVQPLAIVTGAAQRLGKVFALTLAKRGYAILLHYHQSSRQANETAAELLSHGNPVFPFQADLTVESNIKSLLAEIDSLPNRLEVLVNSASVMKRSSLQDISLEEWKNTFTLNLQAPFLLAQHAAARMTEGGLIVNITDVGAHKVWTSFPAYVVSKSALEALTLLQAKTLGPRIRVNAIAPGLILRSEHVTQEEWHKLVERLPLKRTATIEEVSAALTFLLDNSYVTGQTIVVDGGYSLV